jgi:hypothetical protein
MHADCFHNLNDAKSVARDLADVHFALDFPYKTLA